MTKIADIRQEYIKDSLSISDVAKNPFDQFKLWFEQTLESNLFYDPTAFTLSTSDKDCTPHSRVVLLKDFDKNGFTFFTNYNSKKGKDIEENNNVSMLFFWDRLERQVRINGTATRIDPKLSDEYFNSRPFESRIGAIASNQSDSLSSKKELEDRIESLISKYPDNPPRPKNWGGYNIEPNYFEFWQGRESRLHDRIVYEKRNEKWVKKLLNP
ncbi:MAG: pyridoxamine 5'-phosphate oxidase [Chlorobiota bacterium]